MDWKEMTESQNIKSLSIGVSSFTEYKKGQPRRANPQNINCLLMNYDVFLFPAAAQTFINVYYSVQLFLFRFYKLHFSIQSIPLIQ